MDKSGVILETRDRPITKDLAEQAIALDEISQQGQQQTKTHRNCVKLDPIRGVQPIDGLPCDAEHCENFQDCQNG